MCSCHAPKERTVSAASFRDRVVHHALVAVQERAWEPRLYAQSYACRRGLGTHAALKAAASAARRYRYALRLDMRRYFEHIDHAVLLEILAAGGADAGILELSARLLRGARVPGVPEGASRGVPIGNLTSQHWGNLYLHELDLELARALGGAGVYLRYMDDLLVFCDDKLMLWGVYEEARERLEGPLRLEVKRAATRLLPVSEGVPWLGWRLFPGLVRLDGSGCRRLARRLRRLDQLAELDEDAASRRGVSVVGHVAQGSTRLLRRRLLAGLDAS